MLAKLTILVVALRRCSAACTNPTITTKPSGISLLGDVGCTTVTGTETLNHELISAGGTLASNSHIFGPFEAGFTSKQDSIIQNWGCATPSTIYDSEGGTDIGIAEKHIAHACSITFPRTEGNQYYGVVGPCGGHTSDYHFHRHFACLYAESGAHSTKVGVAGEWNVYGKWEDYANNKLPYLDACGGHFGLTPESPSTEVYHYHAQDRVPFTLGCHGPNADNTLVTVAQCRALYTECGDGTTTLSTADGDVSYDRFCPCYDADGSNVATVELPSISATNNWYSSTSATPAPTPAGATTVAPTTVAPTTVAPTTAAPTTAASAAGNGVASEAHRTVIAANAFWIAAPLLAWVLP